MCSEPQGVGDVEAEATFDRLTLVKNSRNTAQSELIMLKASHDGPQAN